MQLALAHLTRSNVDDRFVTYWPSKCGKPRCTLRSLTCTPSNSPTPIHIGNRYLPQIHAHTSAHPDSWLSRPKRKSNFAAAVFGTYFSTQPTSENDASPPSGYLLVNFHTNTLQFTHTQQIHRQWPTNKTKRRRFVFFFYFVLLFFKSKAYPSSRPSFTASQIMHFSLNFVGRMVTHPLPPPPLPNLIRGRRQRR